MQKQKGIIKKFFSLFTYKDKANKEVFYIPEINEGGKNEDTGSYIADNTNEQKDKVNNSKNNNDANSTNDDNRTKDGEINNTEGISGKKNSSQSDSKDMNSIQKNSNKKGYDQKNSYDKDSEEKSSDNKDSEKNDNKKASTSRKQRNFTIRNNNKKPQKPDQRNEGNNNSDQNNNNQNNNDEQKDNKEQKNNSKEFIKPIPISQLKRRKESSGSNSSDNTEKNVESSNNLNSGGSTEDSKICKDIKSNIDLIKKEFNFPTNKDIVIREFLIDESNKAFLVYMEGMVDRLTVNNFILAPILRGAERFKDAQGNCQLDFMFDNVLESHQVTKVKTLREVIDEILVGDTGIYADGCDYLIFCETKGYEKRSVSTPKIEGVVRGSQEGYTESLRTNITLLRRIIKDKDLTTEFLTVGTKNKMNVCIAYLNGVVNPAIVTEARRRLNGINTDFVGSAGMLEQFIEDTPFSIIPTILATERPDRTASHIVEGKIAIIVDGSPYAIIAPVTISSLFHSPEDSSLRWQYGTMLRFIRVFAIFVATMLPGLYIALTTFHTEMIPTDLLIAIAQARENVPFPTIVEVILMEVSFELIREAGIRIPGIVGNTIGIIGALILGQAAVQANLVSPVMIIVIAFTGLGNFAIPDFSLAFGCRIFRVIFIFLGAFLGFYGISLTLVAIGYKLVNLKSFGVPFFSTHAPRTRTSHDVLIQWPIWMQEYRPDNVNPANVRRQPDISRLWTRQKPYTSYDKDGDNV